MEISNASLPPSRRKGGFRETLTTVFYAVVIAIFVRTFAFEPFNIPSGSMKPTLLVGDYLFVSKYSYGYSRHSLPFSLPFLPSDRVMFTPPERGDVAVFKKPTEPNVDFIKRIIGLPGDRVQVVDGVLHINDKPVKREKVDSFREPNASGGQRVTNRYIETLPNGRRHYILEVSDDRALVDNTPVYIVPKEHYFMMGDNRDNSRDSRFGDVGFVPRENLVGRAEMLFFSIDGPAWRIWEWPMTVRFGRLFDGIE